MRILQSLIRRLRSFRSKENSNLELSEFYVLEFEPNGTPCLLRQAAQDRTWAHAGSRE